MAIDLRRFRRRSFARSHSLPLHVLTVGAVLLASQAAQAQVSQGGAQAPGNSGVPRDPWRITPSVYLDETYSDNINLQPKGQERSEIVTTITPSLRITRYGPRVTFNLTYEPSLLYYARGTNGSNVRNYLDATANATLVENLLYFDAQTSVYQQNVSPFGTLAANDVNGSNNRSETRSYSLGPTLKSRLGNDITYAAGAHVQGSSSDNNALTTNHSSQAYANFDTGTSTRNVAYGAGFTRTDQDYGGAGSIVVQSIENHLTYLYSPTLRANISVGYDRNSYPATGQPDLAGVSYSGGFDWTPSQHTRLNARLGRRYFGPTANIVFNEVRPRYSISASYTRDQTTNTNSGLALSVDPNYAILDLLLQGQISDPTQRAQAVTQLLRQAGLSTSPFGVTGFVSNQIYVQKRLDLSVALIGLRNTVTLNAYRTDSQSLSNLTTEFDVFDQANRFRQTGYSANWSHKLGPRTSANASLTKTHNVALAGTGDTRQTSVQVSLNRQIQKNLTGAVSFRHTQQTSDDNNNNGGFALGNYFSGDYRENQVLGSLRLTF